MSNPTPRRGAFNVRNLTWIVGAATALGACASDDPNANPGEPSASTVGSPNPQPTPTSGEQPATPSGVTSAPTASGSGPGTATNNPGNPSSTPVQPTNPTAESTNPQGGPSSEPDVTTEVEVPVACATPSPLVSKLSTTSIAEMGVPFDADQTDTIGPADWNSNYGKSPESIVHTTGTGALDILWRDTSAEDRAFVVHVSAGGEGDYAVSQAYQVATLGQLMGFTRDDQGNYYYVSGVDEDDQITVEYPAEGEYRADIVRLVKFDAAGCVLWETDVDTARGDANGEAEPIVNPMVAGTSRLAWGGGQLALVHSINTAPDDNDVRHQKAITTHFDASDGTVSRTSGLWVSHSFDQRLLWNGEGFIDLHLGDAYPRSIVMSLSTADDETEGYELYFPKGEEGDNATYTQLGAMVPVAEGDYGYWVFFATDRSAELATEEWQSLVGTRDVALARVARDFATVRPRDGGFLEETGTVHQVESSGEAVSNPLRWLTDLAAGGSELHAGRVRAAATSAGNVVVMWEQWEPGERRETFTGTYALELDVDAQVVTAAKKVSDRHIPRGDDAFTIDGHAGLVLGAAEERSLALQLVGAGLEARTLVLP